jgi:hypothetical protein
MNKAGYAAHVASGVEITPFVGVLCEHAAQRSATKAVQGAALALERVHDIEGCNSLPAGVLGVGHSIPDHILQEYLKHTPGLLVDEARDALDASTASQTPDGGLGDACKRDRAASEECGL